MNSGGEITLEASDRLLILAPHPDDETIATGGVIQKAVAEHAVSVLHVPITGGNP